MSNHENAASIEADQDAKNAAEEDRVLNPEPEHATALKKVPRGPFVDPWWIPTCVICGPVDFAMDREDARRAADRHEAVVDLVAATFDDGALSPLGTEVV